MSDVDWTEWEVQAHPTEELFERLRCVTLAGDPGVRIYAEADICLTTVRPQRLAAAQYYVLRPVLERMRALRWHLEAKGLNLLQLEGYLTLTHSRTGEVVDLLPPIVEWSEEANGEVFDLINDGVHRCYLAYLEHRKVQVAYVEGVPAEFPFYAYPIPGDCWAKMKVRSEITPDVLKRWRRIADKKALYRNFDSAFRGVSGRRKEDKQRHYKGFREHVREGV